MSDRRFRLGNAVAALCLGIGPIFTSLAQHEFPAPPRVVLSGYDPVAYFVAGKPVKGSPGISFDWDDGRYHFSSPRHRDIFAADPERYAPRFSGYCTGAIAEGTREEPDPLLWSIVDGKLYLFGSARSRAMLQSDPKGLAIAEKAWRKPK